MNHLFDEWASRYARGENPDPVAYLKQAGADADDLARMMETYLRAATRGEPTEEAVALTRAWVSGASPLVALRASRGIRRDDVVDAVIVEFKLRKELRAKVKRYYHELESGLLDPARLDRRLIDLLARTLGATREALLGWRPRSLEGGFARASEGLVMEGVVSAIAIEPEPEPRDEVDELFRPSG